MTKTNLIPAWLHISSDPEKCGSCSAYHEDKKLCELHNEKKRKETKACAEYDWYAGGV